MLQIKDLAITIMYLYIFVISACTEEITAAFLLFLLGINYVVIRKNNFNSDKKLKECLIKQREGFINLLSHDLRIPAIAQIRALELVKNEKLGTLNSTQKNMLIDIEDSCKCILNLMSLMINTYCMENNTYKLTYEKFNFSDIVTRCFNEISTQASEKNITFKYEYTNKSMNIIGDKQELKKVILNILFSSIANARTGQKILVRIINTDNKICLSIIGDKTKQYDTDTTIKSQYTSIGQNIRIGFCKKIIESHKGKITVDNLNNSFWFELPQIIL